MFYIKINFRTPLTFLSILLVYLTFVVYRWSDNYTRIMRTLGQTIKYFRKKSGLTQEEFADKYGFSHGQMKHWETDRHQPDVESIKTLASIFRISTDTLLNFENEQDDALLALLQSDVKKAYEELDGRQKGRFAKQVSLYVEMLQNNKNIL